MLSENTSVVTTAPSRARPARRWIMAQRWNDLLFMHWDVEPARLRRLVPSVLPLDLRDGRAWISITPFRLSHLRARGMPPIAGVSSFPELNVRTYVTLGGKPGVYFFSLDAGNALAVAGARLAYRLPYYRAVMSIHRTNDGTFHYLSRRVNGTPASAELVVRYRPTGMPAPAPAGSLDHFLVERYCLYTVDHRMRAWRTNIQHRPWPLQPAEVEIERNTMGEAAGLTLESRPHHSSYAYRLDVTVWWPERAD